MKSLKSSNHKGLYLDLIFAAVLILYPMRHIQWGLDFWDTGYNYANFTYMGTECMDPMWLFSTYLANVVGHFLTLLPGAKGLVGMNFYTGLFVSGLAAGGYFFCTRELKIPGWIAFVGEMAAVSLCWCPTALLYNYMSYALFTACVILLYKGLTGEKRRCLFAAGVCLGCNVLVRFSNLPEAAMILAVWAWDFLGWIEKRGGRADSGNADDQSEDDGSEDGERANGGSEDGGRANDRSEDSRSGARAGMPSAIRHTLWCLGGYLAALIVLFGVVQIRYGMDAYLAGISRLFAMTENATDYTAKAMIAGLVGTYLENLYWVFRIGVIAAVGVTGFAILEWLLSRIDRKAKECGRDAARVCGILRGGCRILWCCVAVLMLVWLYVRGFCSLLFYTYGPMERPGILFLMLTMGIGAVRIFHLKSAKEEKLISGMVILMVLLTSIGSNNRVFPSINNLFIAAPYTLWESWRFIIGKRKGWKGREGLEGWNGRDGWDGGFPLKALLAAFLALFLFQSAGFGACFVFAEATGVQNVTVVIDNNAVLKNVKMSPERAQWMRELSGYVEARGLQGREVILFGQVPALSYYLQMPSAFNPWSDLRSYSYEAMRTDLDEVAAGMDARDRERPVLLFDREYLEQYEAYLAGGDAGLQELGVGENRRIWIGETSAKYLLLKDFSNEYNYDLTFKNEKFVLFE